MTITLSADDHAMLLRSLDDMERVLQQTLALCAHLCVELDGKFPTQPKPSVAWWAELRRLVDSLSPPSPKGNTMTDNTHTEPACDAGTCLGCSNPCGSGLDCAPQVDEVEAAILAAGKTAPRVTPADVDAEIVSAHYFTAWHGAATTTLDPIPDALKLLTFCVLVLRNGFTVTGESACASPENFDEAIGRSVAHRDAVAKVWPLLGFRLRDELHQGAAVDGEA